MIEIKIVKNTFLTPSGLVPCYGIVVNGYPRCEFHSQEEVDRFVKAVKG